MHDRGRQTGFRRHVLALILFPLLSLAWVGDTLFMGLDLSAFDVIFRLPHWKAAHEYRGVQQIILSDSPQAHYPERALKWRATRNGERIDFNPYIFAGMPELSQGIGAFVTSPFQLFMDVSEAIDWSSWLRLAAAGLFMYGLLISLEVAPLAAILGGVLWAFNLHQMVWLEYPQHLATQLWIPVLFYFNYSILRDGINRQNTLGIVVANAFFFTSDYIQIVLYTYVAIGLFNTVYLAADTALPARQRLQRWVMVHGAFILAALVLLPKLVVEVGFLSDGLRGQQEWRSNVPDLDWGLEPIVVAAKNMLPDIADYKRYFSPNYFGGLWGESYAGKRFFGNIVGGSTYTGIVVFLLVPAGLLWLKDRQRRPLVLAAGAVLLFAFAMIHKDPLVTNAFNLIPMSGLGGYERYITLITFLLCVLAAGGLHVLMSMETRSANWLFWSIFAVVAASPFWMQAADPSIILPRMRYPLIALAAIGVAAVLVSYLGLWRHLAAVLVLAAVVDLFIVTYGFNPRMEDHRNFAVTPTIEHLIHDGQPYRVAEVSSRQLYPPNILQYYGIPSVNGYSTVAPERYLRFIDETIDDYHLTDNGQLFFFDINTPLFRLLNVKYMLSEHRVEDGGLSVVREAPGYWVYELTDPLDRAYCGSDLLEFESEKDMLDSFNDLAERYDRPVALSGEADAATPLTAGCEVTDIEARLDGVAFTVSTDAPSYVFVPYNYYPDWRAQSDGASIPVLRANYSFIALPVETGTHRVNLSYRDPINVVFNIVMIGLGVVVIAWGIHSRTQTVPGRVLVLAGVVLVAYSLLEIPGIGNDSLPERPPPRVVLPDTG